MRLFLIAAAVMLFCGGQAFGNPSGAPLNLEQMARQKFTSPPLSEAEKRVVHHASDGTIAVCIDLGGGSEPARADGTPGAPDERWPGARSVRADLIRWLVVDREARKLVDPRGVFILGARITGVLDMSYTNALFPLVLFRCRLEQPLNLVGARMVMLSLEGSWTGPIGADGLKVGGAIFLRNGFHAEGEVRLLGASVGGVLDASGGTFKNPNGMALIADGIRVTGGVFLENGFSSEGEVWLADATIGGDLLAEGARFRNSKGAAFNAERTKVGGSVFLRNGFSCEGEARFLGATIGGDLDANGATFKNQNSDNSAERALSADRIEVKGAVLLGQGFRAEGGVGLLEAIIGSDLNANGGTFRNANGNALTADGMKTGGNVQFGDKFDAEGEVRLVGATIRGQLYASRGIFKNSSGNALSADGIKVTSGIFLGNGFHAEGSVRLLNATVENNLEASGGTFNNPGGDALNADRIKAIGDVLLSDGFNAKGEVLLRGATIGGDLNADGGTFKTLKSDKNASQTVHAALGADRIDVTGNVFLRNGFSAEGEVRLPNSTIGGNLEATGGTFKNSDGNALNADRIEVGSVFLNDGFYAEGALRLPGAEIKGQLLVANAELDELNLEGAHVAGSFLWRGIGIRAWWIGSHTLDLSGAKVGVLDDQEASWPRRGGLLLDGFVYDRILGAPTDAKTRLRWLALQPDGYFPQPYEQLIAVLRQTGHDDQVADVAIAKQDDLYKHGELGLWGKFWGWALYHTVRYGYEPWRAFMWMAILLLLGTLAFASSAYLNVMVPSDKDAYESYEKRRKSSLPPFYPRFHAFLYSLDVILPFDLGQKSHWQLHERRSSDFVYWLFVSYLLAQLIAGWALLLIAAGVAAGLVK
jgi:sRNA-binding regulator protein Hfq